MHMIKKVADRYLVAKTIESLLAGTSRNVIERAKGLNVQDRQDGSFSVSGGSDTYLVKTQKKGSDIKVSCTCKGWVFQGSEYYAHERGYLLGKPRGNLAPPKVRDPKGINLVCKHVAAVLNTLQSPMARMGRREDILLQEDISKNVCSNPTKWDNVLKVIEFDEKLDFPTSDEALITKTVRKDPKFKDTISISHPKVLDYMGEPTPFWLTFTEHAVTRMLSRGFTTSQVKAMLMPYFSGKRERFVTKLNKALAKGKALYIGSSGKTAVIRPHTIGSGTKSYRNQIGSFKYDPDTDTIIRGKNVHLRVYTVFSNEGAVGAPLGETLQEYLPCPLPDLNPDYGTHTSLRAKPDYDYSYRFGTMVKRVAHRWLLQ